LWLPCDGQTRWSPVTKAWSKQIGLDVQATIREELRIETWQLT